LKKKRVIQISMILGVVVLFLAILSPQIGKMKYNRVYRSQALRFWADAVKRYQSLNGMLPRNLYDVFILIKNDTPINKIPITLYHEVVGWEAEKLSKDPNYFCEIVDYIFIPNNDSWSVFETISAYPGYVLSINNSYKIEEHKYEEHMFDK
jgi:hypothetical protein